MKTTTLIRILAPLAGALALPTLAHAHSGNALASGCAAGFVHPFHGLDHFIAMIAVGVLAAQRGGHARWLLPAAFLTTMSCAAILSVGGMALPGVEIMIATSVLVFGVWIAAAARPPLALTATIVGFFAIAHGIAHGAEMPANSAALSYGAGFVLATALLHALGLVLAQLASVESARLPRIAGVACAAAGALLLIA